MAAQHTSEKLRSSAPAGAAARRGVSLDSLGGMLVLAAIERAERHEESADVSLVVIGQHLGFVRAAGTTLRLQVDELTSAGAVRHSSPGGKDVWGLTSAGRKRLMRARRAGTPLVLPESPRHREWRDARGRAAVEIDQLREQLRDALLTASELLEGRSARAEEYLALARPLPRQIARLARAIYALEEWEEPDDACSDNGARQGATTTA